MSRTNCAYGIEIKIKKFLKMDGNLSDKPVYPFSSEQEAIERANGWTLSKDWKVIKK